MRTYLFLFLFLYRQPIYFPGSALPCSARSAPLSSTLSRFLPSLSLDRIAYLYVTRNMRTCQLVNLSTLQRLIFWVYVCTYVRFVSMYHIYVLEHIYHIYIPYIPYIHICIHIISIIRIYHIYHTNTYHTYQTYISYISYLSYIYTYIPHI